ncbi:cell wall protein, WapE [Streptococcus criceti]|uniref:Gram-positive cocci surface proteins LPxTG domain-containing protein n=1 Tax=Streptococcus criceti HS-6 TaxID=873449 RepID=G5JTI3_STRCG|nr:putative cross-wall-targeting lipoprotein signal domain-containing proteiin [Streptococcus criceti]EHI75495.1 hypothetical protein STRCR_1080 [Streptococcus criceti HS-6]SUN37655.1 cell wall protein, WapE [Streptococcus criceti]
MQKNTFSKRKTKFAGLCGAILATTTIAMGVGATVQADETAAPSATDATAQETTPADTKQDQKSFETTPVDTSQDTQVTTPTGTFTIASSPAQTAVTAEQTVPAANENTSTAAEAPVQQAPATAASTENSNQASVPASQMNTNTQQPKSADNIATKPADTTEYGSVDFNQTLTSTAKTAPVTDVNYNGSQDVYITVDDPSQPYTPNADNIAKYLNEYLTQLRNINGINVPVPPANDLMKSWAQGRANEEASEADSIDHQTKLAFPSGVSVYSEDGHEDSLSSIAPTNQAGQNLGSDQATAYYLALSWFADYFNIAGSKDDANGMTSFGHALSILSNSGDGMALGFANGTGQENGGFYAMLEFGSNSNVQNNDGFAADTKDANGNWILTYNGKQVLFLPKTTFHYVTKDPNAKPDPNQNNGGQANDSAAGNGAQANDPANPAAGNSDNASNGAGNGQSGSGTAAVMPKTAELANKGAGMGSANASATAAKGDKNLPSTGDSVQTAVTAIGAVMIMAGLGLATKRKIQGQD